jgi:hypothetical protein
MLVVLVALLAAPPAALPAHEGRERPTACAIVEIGSDQAPRFRSGFRATRILDLEFETFLSGRTRRERSLQLRLYTPQGFLYQVLEATLDPGRPRRGVVTCLDAKTGAEVWQQRSGAAAHTASPLFADGAIYFFAEDGSALALAPGREYRELGRASVAEAGVMATPAIAGRAIFLRSESHLYRIEKRP